MNRDFLPSLIRLDNLSGFTGMVICNVYSGSDSYFQIYDGLTLVYSMPWRTPNDAIADFEAWHEAQAKSPTLDLAPKEFAHSYAPPKIYDDLETLRPRGPANLEQ